MPQENGETSSGLDVEGDFFICFFACSGSGPSILFAALFCCHVIFYINNGRYMFASFNISTVYLSIHVYKNK